MTVTSVFLCLIFWFLLRFLHSGGVNWAGYVGPGAFLSLPFFFGESSLLGMNCPSCSAFLRSGCRAAGLWCMWSLESSDVRRPNARDDKLRDKDIFFGPVRGRRYLGPAPRPPRSVPAALLTRYSIVSSNSIYLRLYLLSSTERLVVTLLRTAPWRLTCLERTREVPFSAPSRPVCRPR